MKIFFYSMLILISAGCTREYSPPVKPNGASYLVVEGTLNSGQGQAMLTLSRTTNLDTTATQFESGAQIIIQADDSSAFTLQESFQGQYIANDLNLDGNKKYRLKINTANGEEYVSDFVSVIPNTPIDTINYQQNEEGLEILINTHNPQNNTRYYQWQYEETWEYHSVYLTKLKYIITTTPQGDSYSLTYLSWLYPPDPFDSTIYTCWQFHL
jgi:hypothetical protein